MTEVQIATVAGEYFVAHKIAMLGFVPTLVGTRLHKVDLLVSTPAGDKTVAVQVKSAFHAIRENTMANEPTTFELRFPVSRRAVTSSQETAVYCFVDLKQQSPAATPDVYIVPAAVLREDFGHAQYRKYSQMHYQRPWAAMQAYRNNWEPLIKALHEQSSPRPEAAVSRPTPIREFSFRWPTDIADPARAVPMHAPC